jgi:hypothetical protein
MRPNRTVASSSVSPTPQSYVMSRFGDFSSEGLQGVLGRLGAPAHALGRGLAVRLPDPGDSPRVCGRPPRGRRHGPLIRRRPPWVGSPVCSGVIRARREARNCLISARSSLFSTVGEGVGTKQVVALPGPIGTATVLPHTFCWSRDDQPRFIVLGTGLQGWPQLLPEQAIVDGELLFLRSEALRRDRRPAHLRRVDHRDRHRVIPVTHHQTPPHQHPIQLTPGPPCSERAWPARRDTDRSRGDLDPLARGDQPRERVLVQPILPRRTDLLRPPPRR